VFTQQSAGYQVIASDASSNRQGGVALCRKEHDAYELEEWRFFGPNVLAFRLVTGGKDFYCVECYIPPSEDNQSTLANVRRAQQQCSENFELLLFGDLNIDLEAPRDTREEIIAEQCDYWKLTCMTTMFKQRRTSRQVKGRWTWWQQRLGRWVSTKPNYFLADMAVRRLFKKVVIRRPRYHDSDHSAIIATFWGGQEK
jgi:exonuclease III